MSVHAAGIILYRTHPGPLEVLVVHPGGPFWKNKDDGCWSIPKGHAENGEKGDALLDVAKREFEEETGFPVPPGPYRYVGEVVRARDKKTVRAWACKGSIDTDALKSNTIVVEWPPRSGRTIEVPEIDRGRFVTVAEAKKKISPYLVPLIEQFEQLGLQ